MALNKGSNVHYLLVRTLEAAGLSHADIQPIFLAPADARAAFERGSVDAWAIWDPFEAAAEAATQARTLANGTGLVPNHQFYLAEQGLCECQSSPPVDAIVAAIAEIDAFAKDNTDAVAAELSPSVGIPAADPVGGAEAPDLRRQAARRGRRRRATKDRRCVPQAWSAPKAHSGSRCGSPAGNVTRAIQGLGATDPAASKPVGPGFGSLHLPSGKVQHGMAKFQAVPFEQGGLLPLPCPPGVTTKITADPACLEAASKLQGGAISLIML